MHFPLRGGHRPPCCAATARRRCAPSTASTSRSRRGETLGLVGESGCGKSTLGRCIVGLYEPTAGEIRFAGGRSRANASEPTRRRIQMVFQDPVLVAQPADDRAAGARRAAARARDRAARTASTPAAASCSTSSGSAPRALDAHPRQFSGGQRQRVSIARALALEPEVLVADEPVSALDVSVQATVLNLLADLRAELGLTVLLIAHNMAVVRHVCDRVAVMYLGRIVETAPAERAVRRTPAIPTRRGCCAPCRGSCRAAPPTAAGGRRRSAEPDRPAERLPLPPALPARAAAALQRRTTRLLAGPRRRATSRPATSPGAREPARAHPGGRARGRSSMIERRIIRFEHALLAELELPCFEARGAQRRPAA